MSFYRNNCRKLKGGLWGLVLQVIILPVILWIIYYGIIWLSNKYSRDISFNFTNNYIEILTYISGFLFAGLSILLSNTSLDSNEIMIIRDKYKSYVCEFGGIDNKNCENCNKISQGVKKWITRLKFSLLLDVLVLIALSIISIILSIFNMHVVGYIRIYIFLICIIQLFNLFRRIISYLKIIGFNIK